MPFLTSAQRTLLQGVSRLGYANPFLPERVELERAVLGGEFIEGEPVWSYRAEHPEPRAPAPRAPAGRDWRTPSGKLRGAACAGLRSERTWKHLRAPLGCTRRSLMPQMYTTHTSNVHTDPIDSTRPLA